MRTAALHDGEVILVRPLEEADEGLLEAAFERLSEDARYQRFLTPKPRLSHREAHYMCCVDHHDHEARPGLTQSTFFALLGGASVVTSDDSTTGARPSPMMSTRQGITQGKVARAVTGPSPSPSR